MNGKSKDIHYVRPIHVISRKKKVFFNSCDFDKIAPYSYARSRESILHFFWSCNFLLKKTKDAHNAITILRYFKSIHFVKVELVLLKQPFEKFAKSKVI